MIRGHRTRSRDRTVSAALIVPVPAALTDTAGLGCNVSIVQVGEILQKLSVGSSVAEHDQALQRYFVETATFRALVRDDTDIIAGDKGTGKTALYRILQDRSTQLPELRDIEVLAAFNPVGNPVFQKLADGEALPEGEYVGIWKAYVVALAGNWVLTAYEGEFTEKMKELDQILRSTGLRTSDEGASTVFSQLVNLVRRLSKPSAAEIAVTWTPGGMPIVAPRLEFTDDSKTEIARIEHDRALGVVNDVLGEVGYTAWLVLDRLDEAFQGFPDAEVPALRALLRTYLDLQAFDRIRLKLFLRKDLFRRIIAGGFVNLTHVNARKVEIIWDDEDLFDLLCRRLEENPSLIDEMGMTGRPRADIFAAVFPSKVDAAERKPTTWNWMLSRIRDGNNIKPPRNLIDLVRKAQEAQARREAREERDYAGQPLIGSDALKRGLEALSNERVEDTLLAEAGEYAERVERFRGGKAEHNVDSLAATLDVSSEEARALIQPLKEIGFLEPVGANFKVPMLYRSGLAITQGAAFRKAADDQDEEEEEDDD
jgi:hypothetical protein